MPDIDFDAPAMTNREALKVARDNLDAAIRYGFDLGIPIPPDDLNADHIREALSLVKMVLAQTARP